MRQDETNIQVQTGAEGGKSILITKSNGETQRIELSNSGEVITSNVQGVATAVAVPPPPPAPRRKELPGGLVEMMGIICGMVAITSIAAPLAKAWARRFERRHEVQQNAQIEQRLAAIEQAIETVAVEVERISEGQRFTTKLLADKAQPEVERVR
jgi:hypothetical protein